MLLGAICPGISRSERVDPAIRIAARQVDIMEGQRPDARTVREGRPPRRPHFNVAIHPGAQPVAAARPRSNCHAQAREAFDNSPIADELGSE